MMAQSIVEGLCLKGDSLPVEQSSQSEQQQSGWVGVVERYVENTALIGTKRGRIPTVSGELVSKVLM